MLLPKFSDVGAPQQTTGEPSPCAITPEPATSRRVWAVIVPRQPGDPHNQQRPERVIWIGDPTWRIGFPERCAYCGHTDDCVGVTAHAQAYVTQLSQRDASTVYTLECFTIEPGIPKPAIARQIELMIADRRADTSSPPRS